jgi:hypothetical protein
MSDESSTLFEPLFPKPYNPHKGRFFVCSDVVQTESYIECIRCGGRKRRGQFTSSAYPGVCSQCTRFRAKRYEEKNKEIRKVFRRRAEDRMKARRKKKAPA